jgi:hypothetical protein
VPPRRFAVTWDYRCPFARNAHEHVVTALQGGASWEVTFLPFSLGQVHVAEGEPSVWEVPHTDSGLLALQAAVVVRDRFPERFLDLHLALFRARHERGAHLRDEAVVRRLLTDVGADADAVLTEIADGWPLQVVQAEHEGYAKTHDVWGVPTFVVGDDAAFVRFMHRPDGDVALATRTIERTLDLFEFSDLNEFKHTSLPR